MEKRLYMVIERFKEGAPKAVYQRFRSSGRMLPDGLTYVSSWVEESFDRCYQLMETADAALLQTWMEKWQDLIDFDIHGVMTSSEAAEKAKHLH